MALIQPGKCHTCDAGDRVCLFVNQEIRDIGYEMTIWREKGTTIITTAHIYKVRIE